MKTEQTNEFEKELMKSCIMNRTFGVPEVTIGWYGHRRVDFMEINTKGIIRCYEIKVTKHDFRSKHGHSFLGHYNYYVMPEKLYQEVRDEIPYHVGVFVEGLRQVKKARRCAVKDLENMKLYIIRSMSREVKKAFESVDVAELTYWRSQCSYLKKKNAEYYRRMNEAERELKRCTRLGKK